jgi:hypothetical protein
VHPDEAFDHCKADAEPALRALRGAIELHEEIEHAFELVGWDADAGVSHADDRILMIAGQCQLDATPWLRILARVVQEVAQYLSQARRIGLDAVPLACNGYIKCVSGGVYEWSAGLDRLLQDPAQVN